jgi:hypothetical protein
LAILSLSACGADDSTPPETTEHVHDYAITENIPNCTEGGEIIGTCTCGDRYTEAIDPKEHTYSDWVVTQEPTTEAAGQKQQVCTVCGDTITEELPRLETEEEKAMRLVTERAIELRRLIWLSVGYFDSYANLYPSEKHFCTYLGLYWEKRCTELEYPLFRFDRSELESFSLATFNATPDWTVLNNHGTPDPYDTEYYDAATDTVTVSLPLGAGGGYAFELSNVVDAGNGTYRAIFDIIDEMCEKVGQATLTMQKGTNGYYAVSFVHN